MQYIKNMNTMLRNRVKWHSRWSLIMCVTFMAFMIFGVFLSVGCSSKDTTNGSDTTNRKDQPPNPDGINCPAGTASLAGTCMLDTDGDGTPDSIDDDDDDDDIPDLTDIDDDGDGLIEIDTLERLHNIRYNPAGTSYKIATDGANDAGNNAGCGGIGGVAECNGYELTQDLSFDKDGDGETWSGDNSNGYTLDTDDSVSPHFVVTKVVGSTNYSGGWEPIASFNAIFEGNGHTITGLAIHRDEQSIGMFGFIETDADIRNVGLVDSLVYCIKASNNNSVSNRVGGLVGHQKGGIITGSYATGNARGDLENDYIGGLVGYQTGGSITDSYATSALYGGNSTLSSTPSLSRPGDDSIGGLVGYQEGGSITDSYATGAVDGGAGSDFIGGLVGYQKSGMITASYATGAVKGGLKGDSIGGLVGRQEGGIITDSYATGSVNEGIMSTSNTNGGDRAGGLVGSQNTNGIIAGSHAKGDVEGGGAGPDKVGGLVGSSSGSIAGSYAIGDVTGVVTGMVPVGVGADSIGGLVGSQGGGSIAGSYARGAVDGGYGDNDLIGGLVGHAFGSIAASYARGAVNGGDGNDFVGGLVGSQGGGSIAASYAIGAVDGEGGSGDKAGGLLGSQTGGSIVGSYGFGTAIGGMDSGYGTSIPSSIGSVGTAMERAAKLTSTNAGMLWNDMNKNTLGAWNFGEDSQIPALKYADYDGGDGTSDDHTIYYCDPVEAGKMIPTPARDETTGIVPPPIPIANCGELISGQR